MKRILPLFLAVALLTASLSGCAGKGGSGESLTTEKRTELYKTAIESARDTKANSDRPLSVTGEEVPEIIFEMLGITKDDLSAYAMYVSAMNIQAYAVTALYPAEGKSETVMTGLQDFIDRQKKSFENYLADQYEIARNAKIEKLDDGTILLVMCEGQDEIFSSIKSAINKQGK